MDLFEESCQIFSESHRINEESYINETFQLILKIFNGNSWYYSCISTACHFTNTRLYHMQFCITILFVIKFLRQMLTRKISNTKKLQEKFRKRNANKYAFIKKGSYWK